MKFKTKISALTLALVLGAGALIGCKKKDPEPPESYKVNVPHSEDYTINGISNEKYEVGATVSFTVELLNEAKEISAVGYDTTTLTAKASGAYEFVMPDKNVTLFVTLSNKASINPSYSGTAKVGQTVTFTCTDQDGDPVASFSLSGDATKVTINEHQVTFLVAGEVTITVTAGALSKDVVINVEDKTHGESEDDPLSAAEAVTEGHKLEISWNKGSGNKEDHPSDIFYWIEDEVTKIEEISEANKNATFWMGDFQVYRVRTADDADLSKLKSISVGSVVTVYAKIMNFGSQGAAKDTGTVETYNVNPDYASIKKVDNSVLKEIVLSDSELHLVKDGTHTLTATLLPNTGASVTWESNNTAVATVNNGVVTAVANGEAKITASVGNIKAECKVFVSDTAKVFRALGKDELQESGEYVLATVAESHAYAKGETSGYYIGCTEVYGEAAVAKAVFDGEKVSVKLGDKFVGYEYAKGDDGNFHDNISLVDAGDAKVAKFDYGDDFKLSLESGKDDHPIVDLTYYKSTMSYRSGDSDPKFAFFGYADEVAVESVSIDASAEMYVDGFKVLAYEVNPSYATINEVEWSSDNEAVATVDKDGKVVGVSAGSANIKVAVNGVESNLCAVTVNPKPSGQVTKTYTADEYAAANNITANQTMMPNKTVAMDDVATFVIAGSDSNTGKMYKGSQTNKWAIRLYLTGNASVTISLKSGYSLISASININLNKDSLYDLGTDVDLTVADNGAKYSVPNNSALYSVTVVYAPTAA